MSTNLVDQVLTWNGSHKGLAFSEPLALGPFAGQRLEIEVDEDQSALVVHRGEVVATLLPAHHVALVLGPGEDPGDVGDAELRERLCLDADGLDDLRPRLRLLPADCMALYVGFEPLPVMEWGREDATPFHDAEEGQLDLAIEGVYRLRVNDVIRFYRSFLRNTEDLPPEHFETIASALLQSCVVRSLGRRAQRWDDLPRDARQLTATVGEDLISGLHAVGLELQEVEITRLELPTGMVRVEETTVAEEVSPPSPVASRPA